MRQNDEMALNGRRMEKRDRPQDLDKFTLQGIIAQHLQRCGGTFDMHRFPRIVEKELDIEFRAQKFGFESLRAIFEDDAIRKVCRLDNASSTALVSTPQRSKETPSMRFIKE